MLRLRTPKQCRVVALRARASFWGLVTDGGWQVSDVGWRPTDIGCGSIASPKRPFGNRLSGGGTGVRKGTFRLFTQRPKQIPCAGRSPRLSPSARKGFPWFTPTCWFLPCAEGCGAVLQRDGSPAGVSLAGVRGRKGAGGWDAAGLGAKVNRWSVDPQDHGKQVDCLTEMRIPSGSSRLGEWGLHPTHTANP